MADVKMFLLDSKKSNNKSNTNCNMRDTRRRIQCNGVLIRTYFTHLEMYLRNCQWCPLNVYTRGNNANFHYYGIFIITVFSKETV